MLSRFTESIVEDAALCWLNDLRYSVLQGPEIAPGEPKAERVALGQAVLPDRLRTALRICRASPASPERTRLLKM